MREFKNWGFAPTPSKGTCPLATPYVTKLINDLKFSGEGKRPFGVYYPIMATKRILITGAAGFIGYHLAHYLHSRGDQVLGYDNFNDYYSPDLKRGRARQCPDAITIVEGDICDAGSLLAAAKAFSPTHIVHLAAQAGVRYSLQNPQAYIDSNITGFLNILELCKQTPDIPLIYASSSSVYGLNTKTPYAASDRTDAQASLYGVTKKSNELMAAVYHHLYNIPVTGLRFFTVYGPWGRPDMAYYSFTEKILKGEPIALYNNGQMERDFTYIDDIVAGTAAAIDKSSPFALYNLGNNNPTSLEDFVSILETVLGKKAKKEYLPMQKGDVINTYADISEATDKLGYRPKTPLIEGLRHFVNWYQKMELQHVKG